MNGLLRIKWEGETVGFISLDKSLLSIRFRSLCGMLVVIGKSVKKPGSWRFEFVYISRIHSHLWDRVHHSLRLCMQTFVLRQLAY
jgi:hypothetical protein